MAGCAAPQFEQATRLTRLKMKTTFGFADAGLIEEVF